MADNVIVRVPEQQIIKGEDGKDGASAYEQAVAGGYTGTEAQFNEELASFKELSEQAADSAAAAAQSESNAAGSATTATTKAQEAADSAAQALIRMNSAATSAQTVEDTSSFFTSTILPNAVTTINNTRDQAVANVDVAKSTAVQHVSAEGATQISALQTESTTQQAAIEQKGEDVLESIPADYTDLTEDVDDLKSAKANAATSVVGGTTLLIRDAMEDSALKTLNTDIVPAQQGSGNPTPSNIRPLTGATSLTLTVDNETNGNNAYTYDISAAIGGVMWGGTINAVTGALTVTYYGFEAQDKRWTASSTVGRFFFNPVQNGMPRAHDKPESYCYCSHLTRVDSLPSVGNRIFVNAPTQIAITMEGITSLDALNTYLTAQKNNGTPVQIIYKLESPLEYTLDSSNIILHSGATTITNNISAIMEAEYYIDLVSLITHPRRGAYSPNDISVQYDISGGYYDKGILKLPPNYNTLGDAVPLIVFVHGSADYGSINSTTMSANYETYLNFLRDCGYAVFDCYGWGSKYTPTTAGFAQTWGLPINRDCYISGVNYVCDKYNIDRNNIFVACKSLGGLQALSFFYDSGFPAKAVGMLAPELSIFKPRLGYVAATKKTVAAELGFSEDTGGVLNFDGDNAPEGFWEYITANMGKWCGVFSIFDGLPIKTEDKPSYYLNIQGTSNMCRTSLNRPLKIWIAEDDANVSYPMATAFVKSLNNGGYNGVLRTMPSGTGAHHAVDSDPNALQTTDVTTKCGVHYDTIPTAYYELAQWFDMWLTN